MKNKQKKELNLNESRNNEGRNDDQGKQCNFSEKYQSYEKPLNKKSRKTSDNTSHKTSNLSTDSSADSSGDSTTNTPSTSLNKKIPEVNQKKQTIGVIFMLFMARISVFIRDIMISATFGMNAISDIFLIAFRIPQFFKQFLAEGSINTAFMPNFSKKLVRDMKNKEINLADNKNLETNSSTKYAYASLYSLAAILLIVTILAETFTSTFIYIFSGITSSHDFFDVLVNWTRINFFYVIFIGIASLFNAILASNGFMSLSFIGQILLNFSMILFMFLYNEGIIFVKSGVVRGIQEGVQGGIQEGIARGAESLAAVSDVNNLSNLSDFSDLKNLIQIGSLLCFCVFYSSLSYLVVNSFFARKYGVFIRIRNFRNFSISNIQKYGLEFLKNLAYSMIWVGISQINSVIDLFFASSLPVGTISCIYYADRVSRFPLTLITMPLTLLFLPKLNKEIEKNSQNLFFIKDNIIHKGLMFSVPLFLVLSSFSYTICHGVFFLIPKLLFGKTNFLYSSVADVAIILQVFSASLPALILFKISSMMCFSYNKHNFLLYSGTISIFSNIILNTILIKKIGALGIAIGTVTSSWLGLTMIMKLLINSNVFTNTQVGKHFLMHFCISMIIIFMIKILNLYIPYDETFLSLILQVIVIFGMVGVYIGIYFMLKRVFFKKETPVDGE